MLLAYDGYCQLGFLLQSLKASGFIGLFQRGGCSFHLVESKIASIQVILSNETLSKRRLLVTGDSLLELTKKLADFTDEFLRADHRNSYALVRKGFGIIGAVLVDLLIDWPGYGNRAARTENAIWSVEDMHESGIGTASAFVGCLVDAYAEVGTARQGRFLFKPGS
jgi:hypothetical protein